MACDSREFAPNGALAPWIECFWVECASPRPLRVLPDTCSDLVFSQSGGLEVIGTMTRALLVEPRTDRHVGVRFHAAILGRFLKLPAAELTDRAVSLGEILGQPGRALEERLRNANGQEEALRILESDMTRFPCVSGVQSAIQHLVTHAGQISIHETCRLAGLSARQFRRRCLENVGIAPKRLARIARFRRACAKIGPAAKTDWAALAAETGYFDQAHLIRDFQEFSGLTPGDYAARYAA